jgi:Fe-S oxidoreductase
MLLEARLGLTDFDSSDIWRCVTCNKCVQRCPRGVPIIDFMRSLRRAVTSLGIAEVPVALSGTLRNLTATGNPMGEAQEKRNDWADGLGIKQFDVETEYLFFPCCVTAYDPTQKNSVRMIADILLKAGINFGILDGLNCCGESVRKCGDEALFQSLVKGNMSAISTHKVTKIIVNSPHCYQAFKNDYPDFGAGFEIIHTTQLLSTLITGGRLTFTKPINGRIVYHDPCYLGRHNNVYDEPRTIIKSLPGTELVEMQGYGPDSLCCGGGGARIWLETPKNERFSDTRLQQALASGANKLVTSCPYCLSNLRDSKLNHALPEDFVILDINELVTEAL